MRAPFQSQLVVGLAAFLCHCTSMSLVRTTSEPRRAAKNPEAVEIFTTPPPDRAYREIGAFVYSDVRSDSHATFTARLRRAAAEEGCDAVWVRPDEARSLVCLYYDEPVPKHSHHDHAPGTAQHSFADTERWAREFDAADRDAWQKPDEVVALMSISPGATVVDLGAGTGYFLPRLASAVGNGGRVIGLDIEPNMVEYMRARADREHLTNVDARLVKPDGSDLPRGIDRVLVVDTWHHLEDRVVYAKKLHSALNAGGVVVVVDFDRESPKGPPPAHRLEPQAVAAELSQAGFKSEVAAESLPHQYVVVGRK